MPAVKGAEDAMAELTVLLVDDEPDFRELLAKRLGKRKLRVLEAPSGERALELLTPEIDVVLLDVKMAGLSGIETLQRIKQRLPGLQVIMLTGHANVEVALEGMALGAFDYLIKPVDLDNLVYRIQDACKTRQLAATGPEPPSGT